MEDLGSLSGQVFIEELLSRRPSGAMLPLAPKQVSTLPYQSLDWKVFEALIFQITCERYGIENCSPYGNPGQGQQGLDILVSLPGQIYHVYQCKQVKSFTGEELAKEFSRFKSGEWFSKSTKYILASSHALQQTSFVDELERLRNQHEDSLEIVRLGAHELDQELRKLPALVSRFFSEAHAMHFCEKAELDKYLTSRKPQPEKPVYTAPKQYIPRTLQQTSSALTETQSYSDLFQALNEPFDQGQVNLLLRSNAAYGKTTEILQLLYQLGVQQPEVLSMLILLKNFQPDRSTLEQELGQRYPNWENYDRTLTILVLDGIDEVPTEHFPTFLRDLRRFLSLYKEIRLIFSIRSNFYNPDLLKSIASSRNFKELTLEELSEVEVNSFLEAKLGSTKTEKFKQRCKKSYLDDLLHIPFYLINLCELAQKDPGAFPTNRKDAMEKIIINRCKEDALRFDLRFEPAELYRQLQQLAIVIGLQGRNSILTSEIRQQFTADHQLYKMSSLISMEIHDLENRISFVHANFQEFLLAKSLVKVSAELLTEVLFDLDEANRLKLKLLNVTNYLFSMLNQASEQFEEIFKRISKSNLEILILFEKDKVSRPDRLNIFNGLIATYHQHQYYFLSDNLVSSDRLWEYVDYDPSALSTVLGFANTGTSTSCAAYLDIIRGYPQSHLAEQSRKEIQETLLLIIQSAYEYYIHDRAIDMLTELACFDERSYKIMLASPHLAHKLVRGAIFDYLVKWGMADHELDFILESYRSFIDKKNKISAGLESRYVMTLTDLLSTRNYRKILKYLISQDKSVTKIFQSAGYSKHVLNNFYRKLGEIYSEGDEFVDTEQLLLDFFKIMDDQERSKSGSVIQFYIAAGKPLEGLLKLLEEGYDSLDSYAWIEVLDSNILSELILRYQFGLLDKQVIYEVRGGLGSSENRAMHDVFQNILLKTFPGEFEYAPPTDYNQSHRMRRGRDYQLIDDKELYLAEAESLFNALADLTGKKQPEWDDFADLEFNDRKEIKSKHTSDIIINTIREHSFKGDLASFKQLVNGDTWHWDDYRYNVVMGWLSHSADPPVPEHLKNKVAIFFNARARKHLNLERAVTELDNGKYTLNRVAIEYEILVRQGVLKPSKEELGELLLKDHDGTYHRVGEEKYLLHPGPLYQVVYRLMDDHEYFNQTVMSHLTQNRVRVNSVMITYVHFIAEYNLSGLEAELIKILESPKWNDQVKNKAVKTWLVLNPDLNVIREIIRGLPEIGQKWHWKLISTAEEENSEFGRYLHLAEKKLPKDILEMESWQGELIQYGLKTGSKVYTDWFFDQLRFTRNFDCNEKEIEIWTHLITEHNQDKDVLLTKTLGLLDMIIKEPAELMWCKRRKIVHLLITKIVSGDARRYRTAINRYRERIEFFEKAHPLAKDHYKYLSEFEKSYFLEKPYLHNNEVIAKILVLV